MRVYHLPSLHEKDGMRTETKFYENKSFTKQPLEYTEVRTVERRCGCAQPDSGMRCADGNLKYIHICIYTEKQI